MSSPPFRQITTIFETVMGAVQAKMPEVSFSLGAKERYGNNIVPRYCWVPSEDSYREPMGQPSRNADDPVAIWTKESAFEIDIWGADIDATEELNRLFLETLSECISSPAYNLRGGKWDTSGETAELGILYTLLLDFYVPVTISSPTTVVRTISALPLTKVIETP